MKAVRIHEFGGPDVLHCEEVARPAPKRGQVLVRVKAAGVGVWEIDIREGGWQGFIDYPLPLIIGTDMSGIIEEVGSGVKDFRVGDQVYGVADMTLSGAYAQYALAKPNSIARKPDSLSFVEAASVPVSAVTAWLMVYDLGKLRANQTILIHGAAGAVGAYAVQLAKLKGAQVIATAAKRDKRFVGSLGADTVVDYQTQDFEDFADNVDIVIDLVGGDTRSRSFAVIKKGGALITAPDLPTKADMAKAKRKQIRAEFVECVPTSSLLKKIGSLIEGGDLRTNVGNIVPLSKTAQAQKMLEKHREKRGKVVLKVA